MLKLIVFVFVGESLLSRIQGNSDGQSNFNLILQKLSIFKNDVSSNSILILLAKFTLVYFFIVAESLFKSLVFEIIRMVDV